jgi:hypothetical protein
MNRRISKVSTCEFRNSELRFRKKNTKTSPHKSDSGGYHFYEGMFPAILENFEIRNYDSEIRI